MTSGVYVIQCKNKEKIYVGKSDNIEKRTEQHDSGDGAQFIKNNGGVYKQLDLITPNNTEDLGLREQQETIAQMLMHGFNNVRGWEFTSSNNLTYEECVSIKTLILGSGDFCRKCGSSEHFAKDCENKKEDWLIRLENCMKKPMKNTKKEENIFKSIINNKKNTITDFELEFAKTNRGKCKICESNIDKDELKLGIKETNFKNQEYTKWYHINCFKKHNNIDMNIIEDFYNKHSIIENQIKPVTSKKSNIVKNACFRCGRTGHYADNCYAKTDINGESIDEESSEEEVWSCSYCNKEFDTEKGALFHEYKYCKRNPKKYYY